VRLYFIYIYEEEVCVLFSSGCVCWLREKSEKAVSNAWFGTGAAQRYKIHSAARESKNQQKPKSIPHTEFAADRAEQNSWHSRSHTALFCFI